jgi:hypothetical protein
LRLRLAVRMKWLPVLVPAGKNAALLTGRRRFRYCVWSAEG